MSWYHFYWNWTRGWALVSAKWCDLCQKWGRFPHWCTQVPYWHQNFSAHLLLV
jgi:hypothetical protein